MIIQEWITLESEQQQSQNTLASLSNEFNKHIKHLNQLINDMKSELDRMKS